MKILPLILIFLFSSCFLKKDKNHINIDSSPYLLKSKASSIWWHEWNDNSLKKAKRQGKLIFVNLGRSTCQECLEMDKKVFKNKKTVEYLNNNFINIKVDQLQNSDLTNYLQTAASFTNKHTHNVINALLTPDGTPFFAFGYKNSAQLKIILLKTIKNWKERKEVLKTAAKNLKRQLTKWDGQTTKLNLNEILKSYYKKLIFTNYKNLDMPIHLKNLINYVAFSKDKSVPKNFLNKKLKKLYKSKQYDHLAGGFFKFDYNANSSVENFEKSLSHNIAYCDVLLDAYKLAPIDNVYAKLIVKEIFNYFFKNLQSNLGLFHSYEGEINTLNEGEAYGWHYDELKLRLSRRQFKKFEKYFNLSKNKNFKNQTQILDLKDDVDVKKLFSGDFQHIKNILHHYRSKRNQTTISNSFIVSDNASMISILSKAYLVLGDKIYLEKAEQVANFLLLNLDKTKKLNHIFYHSKAHGNANLKDYAYLIEGLINLYNISFKENYLLWAIGLQQRQEELWSSKKSSYNFSTNFYFKTVNFINLHKRNDKNANIVSAKNLLKLYHYTFKKTFAKKSHMIYQKWFNKFAQNISKVPNLIELIFIRNMKFKEIVLVEGNQDSQLHEFKSTLSFGYNPASIIAKGNGGFTQLKILQNKISTNNKPTAYVCTEHKCKPPINDPQKLSELIKPEIMFSI